MSQELSADAASPSLVPLVMPPPPSAAEVLPLLIGTPLSEIERELIVQTLARCNGNRTHAARLLGMPVRTLRNKIRSYTADGIAVPAYSA
ncbi:MULTISPECIES: helix-turn-helix domain-containing protein [unclassified Bradyrhizobium]|uniref:helix-turn-helix domain-containing protein n=1 Tax=unclassified Bradyrhizobium TaxID=2631580 RepID=UPI000240748D|nr:MULTISPECIES: helix-turn-helix domain-containing protein [unclassified Bradyrhizobium]CCD93130.1 putative transcriptional regulator (Helix-turn-helix, Fis-type) [Bradyrhizobium sp. ORS 375]CCE02431.1 putative transcriptional regulator (Helix-turn-helix, Fis-type) [Bradyrhizobium sp. STM 3809]